VAYSIEFTTAGLRDLKALPANVQKRVINQVEKLVDNPRPYNSVKIEGGKDAYRIRVGDYRVLYQIREKVLLILVVRVRHRKDAYKNL
jgi:mRNA interferase RelE/StbE